MPSYIFTSGRYADMNNIEIYSCADIQICTILSFIYVFLGFKNLFMNFGHFSLVSKGLSH